MEIFELDAKNHTPYIKLDHTTGIMELKGRSTPENSVEFYDPVNKWLIQFINEAVTIPVIVKLKFEYFNTSSSKCILDVLKKFAELKKTGADVKVEWYYEQDDDDMKEAAEDYSDIVKIPFEIIEIPED
jgi:hypothetical protein